jgi:uncharacterized protein (DUF362 family)/Pyruvate/2-oxoacid:ferredoxin oxidoreductase delta subunit
MEPSNVIIRKASYEYSTLKPVIFEIADSLCPASVRSGSRVIIKPNLLAPASPDRAIVTHPHVVKAIAEYLLERGARVTVSDSQAMGTFQKTLKESGLRETLKGLAVEFREFRESVNVDIGEPFKEIAIARDIMEADAVVNVPKLKTHVQMLMTLGVKNLFGCIVGLRKPEWHFRTGVNRELFARLLVQIHNAVRPAFTVIDGILAMEGEGPGRSGTPRELGLLAGSDNAIALDITLSRMLGLTADRVFTNKAAGEMGCIPESIAVSGEMPLIEAFRFPEIVPLVFGPGLFHGFMRRHLVQRPVPDTGTCRMCGECRQYCPARAITEKKGTLHIDYDRCIRCYCCIEVCPHGALRSAEPLAGKVVRRFKMR